MADQAVVATHRGMRWLDVLVPIGGPAALVLTAVASSFFEPTRLGANPTMSGSRLIQVLAEEVDGAPAAAASYLLAAASMLVFAGALWDHLRIRGAPQWPAVVAAGGAIVLAVELVNFARAALSAMVAVQFADEVTGRMLISSTWEGARLVVAASLAMMFGAAVAGLRGALPRWFAVLSLAGAVGAFAALLATGLPVGFLEASPAGLLALASVLWTFPAGLVMSVRAARWPG